MRWLRGLGKGLLIIGFILLVVLLARGLGNYSRQPLLVMTATQQELVALTLDEEVEAAAFAAGLQLPTVYVDEQSPTEPFVQLLALLMERYPAAHKVLKREVVNEYSVIYRWSATEAVGDERLPVLFLAHSDVVPVAENERDAWTHPPFAGVVADGYIWGRGALDFKLGVFAQLAAVNALAEAGYQPQRGIVLAFGHDEEIRGANGAYQIAERFKATQQRFALTVDEGGAVSEGVNTSLAEPVAAIGVAEKAYLTLEVVVNQPGGHSSMPAAESATTILSRAVTRLQANPMPAAMSEPVDLMLNVLAPEAQGAERLALSNRWLFEPAVQQQMASSPVAAASMHNTQAVTMLRAGIQENVVPAEAIATVNFRLLPGVHAIDVVRHVQQVIADERVYVVPKPQAAMGEYRVADYRDLSYQALASAVRQTWPDAVVTPHLALASMDARHFEGVSEQVLRFAPLYLRPGDAQGIHGVNERIRVADYLQAIRFYATAFQYLAGEHVSEEAAGAAVHQSMPMEQDG